MDIILFTQGKEKQIKSLLHVVTFFWIKKIELYIDQEQWNLIYPGINYPIPLLFKSRTDCLIRSFW